LPESRGFHFIDLAITIAKNRVMIGKTVLIAAVLSAIISLLLPKHYTAFTTILPPQKHESGASFIMGQLAPLANMVGAGQDLGFRDPSELYMGMLHSRTVADNIIRRFDLLNVYQEERMIEAREDLDQATGISSDKSGLIAISVEDRDPQRAAAIAAAYVEELRRVSRTLAISEASQRRVFFEDQLKQANESLKNAEVELAKTQQKTGLIDLDNQAKVILESIASMRAQIAAKEVELKALRTFGTEQNPDVIRTQEELSALRSQLGGLEHNEDSGNGDIYVSTKKIPASGLEYVRRLRDVKYYETLFELLARQFEMAKIDEAKDSTVIQVLDEAQVPERRSRPRRTLIVIQGSLLALFCAIMFALFREFSEKAKADPEQAARIMILKNYLSFEDTRNWLRSKGWRRRSSQS